MARSTVVPWLAFLGLVAVAAATGVDPLYAWIGTPERRFGALAWLLCGVSFVVGQQLDEDDARFVAGTAAAAGAVALVLSGARAVPPVQGSLLLDATDGRFDLVTTVGEGFVPERDRGGPPPPAEWVAPSRWWPSARAVRWCSSPTGRGDGRRSLWPTRWTPTSGTAVLVGTAS